MIEVSHLTRRFGAFTALDDLNFSVRHGEIVGFIGRNGAGKTTTMRILSGFMPATGGSVRVAGLDVFLDSLGVRRRVGYLPENVPLYLDMRVNEYLDYRARLKGLEGRRRRSQVDEVIASCGLSDVSHQVIGRLSKGMRQRVGLADALVHTPEVLILDEPMIGLDPSQTRQVRALIRALAGRQTVLLSSHILPDVEMLCDRALIIDRGRIVADDSMSNLARLMKGNAHVLVEIRGAAPADAALFEAVPGVVRVAYEPLDGWLRFTCECEARADVRLDLFRLAGARGWDMRELRAEGCKLEDVFMALTASTRTGASDAAAAGSATEAQA